MLNSATWPVACALLTGSIGNSPALAQSATAPESAAGAIGPVQDPFAEFRPVLLREGSRLVEARGRMHRDPGTGWWMLRVDSPGPTAAATAYDLVLLPGTLLSEMQHVLESTPNQQVTFEVTGDIFVFRGRNFLMPAHAPTLVWREPATDVRGERSEVGDEKSAVSDQPSATIQRPFAHGSAGGTPPQSQPAPPIKTGDSAEDIIRGLQQSVGPVPQHVAADRQSASPTAEGNQTVPPTPGDASSSPSSTPPLPRAPDDALRSPPSEKTANGSPKPQKLLHEGTLITSRRGKLTRDSSGSGGWQFIFDADATGLADPPVRLLPCLLLERLEDFARHSGPTAPILLSGQVYVYGGRNYLLPTVFRIPRERSRITP